MKASSYIFFIALGLLFFGCKSETIEDAKALSLEKDFKKIKRVGYSVMLPNYMEESLKLNPDASLKYASEVKNEFLIIINESKSIFEEKYAAFNSENKSSTLENYSNTQLSYTKENMNVISFSKPTMFNIGNIKGVKATKEIKLAELTEPVSYFFFYLESKTQLFTIMAWTIKQNTAIYEVKLEKTLRSFRAQ